MASLTYKGLLLISASVLSGCAVNGYNGAELPDDQVAAVRLKAPTISLIPIFWIFPLNMLAWLDDDWHETTTTDEIQVNGINLDRFKTVLIKSGENHFLAKEARIASKVQTGGTEYSYGSCFCTETLDNDKKKEIKCSKTTTESRDYRVTVRNEECAITYPVQAQHKYEVFMRNEELLLQDESATILANSACELASFSSYTTTESSYKTENC